MGEAQRKRLDHVVLPRRLPGLALLERYFPSPADNQLDAFCGHRRREHTGYFGGRRMPFDAPGDLDDGAFHRVRA